MCHVSDETMCHTSTRVWLDERKREILDSTYRINDLVAACPHYLVDCPCVNEIRKIIDKVVNIASTLLPYTTDRRVVNTLRYQAMQLKVRLQLNPSLVEIFSTTANGISVDPVRRPHLSLLGFDIPSPFGSIKMLFRRDSNN